MRAQTIKFHHFLLLLVTLFQFHSANSKPTLKLRKGDSISVEDDYFITSPDNSFSCGFYDMPDSNAYWFAIWFTNSKDKTTVWTANRDKPVNSQGSRVSIEEDGTMVLTDVDRTIIWQTNTSATGVTAAELLDTGNLVLMNSEGQILWQSFDFPTDTLLPSQTLTKNKKLISSREGTLETGHFNLYFGADNVLYLVSDNPEWSSSYWPDPYDDDIFVSGRTMDNGSRIAVLDDMGMFQSSDLFLANATDKGFGTKRRLTLDHDGNLRIYSLNNSTGLWLITWQALSQPCKVFGVCGNNALCVYGPKPKCVCTPGYEVNDLRDWKAGCKPTFNQSALISSNVTFLEIYRTDYFGYDLDYQEYYTLEACLELCSGDSRCKAFTFNGGYCYVKFSLFNGAMSPDFTRSTYIKLPMNVKVSKPSIYQGSTLGTTCQSGEAKVLVGSPSMYHFPSKPVKWVYIYSFCAALGGIELIFIVIGWWFLYMKHGVPASVEAGYRMILGQFRRFNYSELKKATNNFREELGQGGSGAVYKGVLADDRVVAVKRLRDMFQGQEELWSEMRIIGKINHVNLVRMWGFCSEERHQILVYEFVDNMSLDKHLFSSNFLGWEQRFKVALGTAKGLAYLHHECLEWVIHCDVKPENILLDSEFQPKIADFGLAKLSRRESPGSEITKIRGTKGYMAPEWALNQPITAKVDVYSYGVVVLEMVKGMKLSNWALEDEENQENPLKSFDRIVKEKVTECGNSSWIDSLVDPRFEGNFSRKQATTLIEIGLSCVDENRSKRPTMDSVVQTLMECEDETETQIQNEL